LKKQNRKQNRRIKKMGVMKNEESENNQVGGCDNPSNTGNPETGEKDPGSSEED
jgi:hypothetical protein